MGPTSSREQIGEQIGDDDGLQIHPKTAIVANNVVSITRLSFSFASLFLIINRLDRTQCTDEGWPAVFNSSTLPLFIVAFYNRLQLYTAFRVWI